MSELVLLKRKEVAATFGIQPRTVLKWEKRGIIKPCLYINGRPRYLLDDITKIAVENQEVYKGKKR